MARIKKVGTALVEKDPNEYAWAVEKGYSPRNIPKRPLFGRTLKEFRPRYKALYDETYKSIRAAWS